MIFSVERVKVRGVLWFQCKAALPSGCYASESYTRTRSRDWNSVALGSREPFGEGKERGQGKQFSVAQVRSGPHEAVRGRPNPHS